MHSSKEFLLLECESIRRVLQETLRYDYGGDGSSEFFEECEVRLDFIKSEISNALPDAHAELSNSAMLLIELSDLLARIERSFRGEYSWPFVEELKNIAAAICTEATLDNPHTPPKVHVLSDGGLDKYSINPEQKRPSAGKRRILTIVFPRSLKHFVLLHSVMGHELGHAIWRGSEHELFLKQTILNKLIHQNQVFSDPTATSSWMYSANAPETIRQTVQSLEASGVTQDKFFSQADWRAWVEEICCDLIGLATFGPSFVAALTELLFGILPSGCVFSIHHPPNGFRINLMLQAIRVMGYDQMTFPNEASQQSFDNFYGRLHAYRKDDAWFNAFSDEVLLDTLTDIHNLLGQHPPALYTSPSPVLLGQLVLELERQIPPSNFSIGLDGVPVVTEIDFRHILFAGWIAAQNNSITNFSDMNKLCEHAIMQQRAIKLYAERVQ